jgi:hypothetical protein
MTKTASLIFFYFGESSYMNRLAQETVPLYRALEGYDLQVLLRHETDIGPFELSEAAEQAADILDLPTKENLVKYLNELGSRGYTVDLYIFSHGWNDLFRTSKGTYGDNEEVNQKYLEANVRPLDLRMVWQCNCYGSTLNDCWRNLGAKATAGARFVNFYPTRFKPFIKAWNTGKTLEEAIAGSNTRSAKTPVQIYLPIDALTRLNKWNGSITGAPWVLSRTVEARQYFETCWLDPGEWQEGKSGKENMDYSSEMIIEGDGTITKSQPDAVEAP